MKKAHLNLVIDMVLLLCVAAVTGIGPERKAWRLLLRRRADWADVY